MPFDRPSGPAPPDQPRDSDRPERTRIDNSRLAPNSDLVLPYLSREAHREQIAALDDDRKADSAATAAEQSEDGSHEDERKSSWDLQREAVEKDRAENPRRLLSSPSVPDGSEPDRPVRLEDLGSYHREQIAKLDDENPVEEPEREQEKPEPEDNPESGRRFKTVTEELGEPKSWHSFDAARREIRARLGHEPGIQVDHIVEQCQADPKRSGFDVRRINSSDNMARLDKGAHQEKTSEYASNVPGLGIRLRDMLNGAPWEEQHERGCEILNEKLKERRDRDDD